MAKPLIDADGTVIGTGGCGSWVCSRSAADRRGFKCQTSAMDALTPRQVPVCPKTKTFRDRIDCGAKNTWMDDFGQDGKRRNTMAARTNRRSLTFDEALMSGENEQLADSGQAHRILKACAGSLDMKDIGLVIEMLKAADKLSDDEADAITASLDPDRKDDGGAELAADAAIMVRRREQVAAGLRPAACLSESIGRVPDASGFLSRFPDAARIRTL